MIIKFNKKIFILFLIFTFFITASFVSADVISVFSEQKTKALPIVMYHQLTKDKKNSGKYVLTVEQFEKDLIFLKENEYKSVTLEQLIDYSNGKDNLPDRAIMITFDDGCETLYSYALPLLEKYGFTAIGFAIGALADKYSEINDHNLLYSNLTWEEIKELCSGEVIDIQSHTYNLHDNTGARSGVKKLKSETFEQYSEFLTADMVKMKEKMIEHTGSSPIAIAYPFGSYSSETKDVLIDNGIKMAFTCEEKINIIKKSESEGLFRLGRFNRPEGISSESFFEKMGIG